MNNLANVTWLQRRSWSMCSGHYSYGHWCFSIRSFTWKPHEDFGKSHMFDQRRSAFCNRWEKTLQKLSGDFPDFPDFGDDHIRNLHRFVWFFWGGFLLVTGSWPQKLAAGRSQTFQEPDRGLFSREFHRDMGRFSIPMSQRTRKKIIAAIGPNFMCFSYNLGPPSYPLVN